jgi:vacuolar protein sorting-associated protein 33B
MYNGVEDYDKLRKEVFINEDIKGLVTLQNLERLNLLVDKKTYKSD